MSIGPIQGVPAGLPAAYAAAYRAPAPAASQAAPQDTAELSAAARALAAREQGPELQLSPERLRELVGGGAEPVAGQGDSTSGEAAR